MHSSAEQAGQKNGMKYMSEARIVNASFDAGVRKESRKNSLRCNK